jgi:putative endonuclease
MPILEMQRIRLLEQIVQTADGLTARLRRRNTRAEHLEVGQRGEDAAYFYLRRRGYIVVARSWRSAKLRGDLDLVAWDDSALCFVEVKTRTSRKVATAESAVDEEKIRMLRRMARQYIHGLGSAPELARFDVLSVYLEAGKPAELELICGAFGWY